MRIWSIHPKYLDAKGLVALWREGLLAQNVLTGKTKGYRNHPQLERFKTLDDPAAGIALYLRGVYEEAQARQYNFQEAKIRKVTKKLSDKIPVPWGQIIYEFHHLKNKLKIRDQERFKNMPQPARVELHYLFKPVDGGIADWERVL